MLSPCSRPSFGKIVGTALVGFLHRTDADVGDFGGAWQAKRVCNHLRDVLRLHQRVRVVGAAFLLEKLRDAGRCGAARVNAEDADAVGVHFVAQAVCDGAKRVLSGGKLSGTGGRAESRGRIDEYDLAFAFAQKGKHGLDHEVVTAHVRTVHQVEIGERSFLQQAVEDGAAPEHQNIYVTKMFLKLLAKAANLGILVEIRRTTVAAQTERVDLPRNFFQEFAAPRHQADLGAVPGYREGNRFADTAAGPGHHSYLIL